MERCGWFTTGDLTPLAYSISDPLGRDRNSTKLQPDWGLAYCDARSAIQSVFDRLQRGSCHLLGVNVELTPTDRHALGRSEEKSRREAGDAPQDR